MTVYLVACELRKSGHDYSGFEAALADYDSTQLLDGAFLIDAPTDAETLRRHLSALVAKEDRVWVSRLTEEHSGYVMSPAVEWLEQRRPL